MKNNFGRSVSVPLMGDGGRALRSFETRQIALDPLPCIADNRGIGEVFRVWFLCQHHRYLVASCH
jgi:hypothetical protein